jgi:hypothetical protein
MLMISNLLKIPTSHGKAWHLLIVLPIGTPDLTEKTLIMGPKFTSYYPKYENIASLANINQQQEGKSCFWN